MKILQLTTHLEMGGIPIYVTNLSRGLVRRGHSVTVASSGGWLEHQFLQDGVSHWKVPCRTSGELNPKLWLRAFPQLLTLFRRQRPDILHAHTRVTQVLAGALSRVTRVPYVTTCHGFFSSRWSRRFFRCWGRWVMAVSESTRDRLVAQYNLTPPHCVLLIRNGIEVDRFVHPVPLEKVKWFRETIGLSGQPVVGTVARFSPVKGLDTFLKALPPLLKTHPAMQVLLVGDGPSKPQLIRLAYELGIADRVVITHPVDDTRIPLATMDCFVAPSLEEGFGLAIVEAMAAGVPVVASDVGGPAEIIETGKTGFLVSPENPHALVQSIGKLLGDLTLRTEIVRAARERARSQFDMRRVIEEVEAVYARTLA